MDLSQAELLGRVKKHRREPRTVHIALALGIAAIALTGCGASSSNPITATTVDGMTLLSVTKPSDNQMLELVQGILGLTESGCVGIGNGATTELAVFPKGTTLRSDGIDVPGLGSYNFGDEWSSGGGSYYPFTPPAECGGEQGVTIIN